jgi:hypothetical protein
MTFLKAYIKSCSVDGCDRSTLSKGLCSPHYQRFKLYGDPLAGGAFRSRTDKDKFVCCSVSGCSGNSHYTAGGATGLCKAHYYRNRRHGSPEGGYASPGSALKWIEEHKNYQGDDCIRFPFATDRKGYGVLYVGSVRKTGHNMQASRYMCIVAHGEPPTPAHHAAHSCGNGHLACTNQKHLRWATPVENHQDQVQHGTFAVGEAHPNAKLTDTAVVEIRTSKATAPALAAKFNVSEALVYAVKARKRWKEVGP